MPWFRVSRFDANGGSVGDLPPQAVPPSVFTYARDVRFVDGAVEKRKGRAALFGVAPIDPYHLLPSQDNVGSRRLFIAGLAKIYAYASGSYTDVTRTTGGDYTATASASWTSGVLHGVPFINNGVDAPQSWNSTTEKFQNLPNWPSGYTARALRPFKNFLFALNYNNGATQFPHNVLWSQPADPGSVPSSWDITDPTKDAGDAPLSETPGHIIDGGGLGDQFIVYKEDAVYTARFTGAPFIFSFKPVLRESGILAANCFGEVLGKHVVLTADDVVLFDGQNAVSIINKKWRRALFNDIVEEELAKSFVFVAPDQREVWICVSTVLGSPPNIAYVWNWKENSWAVYTFAGTRSIVHGFSPDAVGSSWDSDSGTWDSDSSSWDTYSLLGRKSMAASLGGQTIYTLNVGEIIDTGDPETSLPLGTTLIHESFDFSNDTQADTSDAVKHISKVRPRLVAEAGTQLSFYVGTQMHINDPITWTDAMVFTVGTDTELCLGVNGRYISWKILGETENTWRLEALDFLVQSGGRY